jgi:hypothetical protein
MKSLLVLLGILTAAIVAGPASADPTPTPTETAPNDDADFLSELRDAGITFQDGNQAVVAGKNVCQWADAKTPYDDIVKEIQSGNPSLADGSARNFMILAANEYCPKYLYDH